jgi:hypothetical protein
MPPHSADLILERPSLPERVRPRKKPGWLSGSGFPSLQCLVNDANQIVANAADYDHGWNSPE